MHAKGEEYCVFVRYAIILISQGVYTECLLCSVLSPYAASSSIYCTETGTSSQFSLSDGDCWKDKVMFKDKCHLFINFPSYKLATSNG